MGQSRQVQKAAADGKLTASEIKNLSNAGIGMDKVLKVAGNQGATIAKDAQQAFGISQNKGTGLISYTPALTPGAGGLTAANAAYGIGGAATPKPGSGWVVSGQAGYQTNDPATGSTNNVAPTYTYMGAGVNAGKSSAAQGSNAIYPGVSMAPGGGPNNIGPLAGGVGPLSYGTTTTTTAPTTAPTDPMQSWLDSLGIGLTDLMNGYKDMLAQNQAMQQGYQVTIDNLVGQLSTAGRQMFSGPYAVTTQNAVPVMGAQTTQAISRRLRTPNTSLSIRPETASAGTGLNIAA